MKSWFLVSLFVFGLVACSLPGVAASVQHRALLIGDSQSYRSLALPLQTRLSEHQWRLDAVAQSGATPSWYLDGRNGPWGLLWAPAEQTPQRTHPADTPRLDTLLKQFHPETVIIQLGGNSTGDDPALTEKDTRQLIAKIRASGATCYWIGPPPGWARPKDRFPVVVDLLKRVSTEAKACAGFLDSRFLQTPDSGGDGKHLDTYGPEGDKLLAQWLERILAELGPFLAATSN